MRVGLTPEGIHNYHITFMMYHKVKGQIEDLLPRNGEKVFATLCINCST